MTKTRGGISTMGATIITDPVTAKARILKAIDDARGNRGTAAKALGTQQRTLYRWIARLDMWGDVDRLCTERGYPVQPGPRHG